MTIPEPPRSLNLRVDTQALAANWQALNRISGDARAGAAVKANGYGLGAETVVKALAKAGARDFFVAHWSEVAPLLSHVEGRQISVLHGPLNAQDAAYARATGSVPVINNLYQASMWLQSGGGACHVMIDTGMNRLGIGLAELGDPLIGQLQVHTLLSHLASADEDSAQNSAQLAAFRSARQVVDAREYSLANSAGIALGPDYTFDLTRPGLALYGGVPRAELAGVIGQVVYLQAAILQLRDLKPGDKVGYNSTFTAPHAMRAATISIGYADGFLRCWGRGGSVEHKGVRLPLIGRVSMDMVVADCSAASDLRVGDLIDIPYNLQESSEIAGLSQYELLTILGGRFARAQ